MIKHFMFFTFLLLSCTAQAQKRENLYIRGGLNFGNSILFHKTDFVKTPMYDKYEEAKYLFNKRGIDYEWSQFVEDYKLRESYAQFRYGLNLFITHKIFPVFANMEFMSSSSSFQKFMFGLTLGISKDYRPINSDLFFSGRAGFKRVFRDSGFGSETLIFSIRDKFLREQVAGYFNPQKPLGAQSGNLITLNIGCGHVLGGAERGAIGVEAFYELDITNETVRQARMTNLGIMVYYRFDLANTSF